MAKGFAFKGTFKQHASGRDVAAVKRCLKRLGHKDVKITGPFEQAAVAALKVFQHNHKLKADGIFGKATFEAMSPLMKGYEVWLYKHAKFRKSALTHWAALAPGADRYGAHTKQYVLDFVSKVAHIYGHPLVITVGTNHNQFVKGTNHQSDHWTGDAGDVGMYGSNLTRLGQCALQAAGMPWWRAKLCRGGVYNVGRWNILFNTTVGGNHWNHCHMGGGH